MRRPKPWQGNDAEEMNQTWNAFVRDGEIRTGRDGDNLSRMIARLHAQDDAPHADPAFADRLLYQLIAQHPATSQRDTGHENRRANRSNTMQQFVELPSTPTTWPRTSPRRRPSGPKGAMLGSGWTDLVAVAAVVMLIFSAVVADRGRSPDNPSSTQSGFQLVAATPEGDSAEGASGTTMYRSNPGRTGELPGPGPDGVPTLAWKRAVDGQPGEGPVVADGRLYYAAQSEQTQTLDLRAADLATGEELWRAPIDVAWGAVPAVANGMVYINTSTGMKKVQAHTGTVVWTFQSESVQPSTSPLLLDEGVVYVPGPDNAIHAFNVADDQPLWSAPFPGTEPEGSERGVLTQIAASDDAIIGRSASGTVAAFDKSEGSVLWATELEGPANEAILVADGVVAVTSIDFSVAEGSMPVRLHGLDAGTGEPLWEPVSLTSPSTLTAADGSLFVADTLEATGTLTAFDLRTSEMLWTHEMGGVLTSPVYVDGWLYVLSEGDGTVRRIDAESGEETWSVYLAALGAPVVAEGLLVAIGNETLYAVTGQGTPVAGSEPVDLSGLPACTPPRLPPGQSLTGEPALTVDVESRSMDDSGSVAPPTTIDAGAMMAVDWPVILAENVPSGEPASADQVAAVKETMAAMAACSKRLGSAPQLAGFYSDDFYRRGVIDAVDAARAPQAYLGIQPDEEQLTQLEVSIGADGRLSASTVNESGYYGTLMIFVEVDGALLVDEAYFISPEYPVSA